MKIPWDGRQWGGTKIWGIGDDTGLAHYWPLDIAYTDVGTTNTVINGNFDTADNWSTGAGWSISGGKANCDGTQTGNSNLFQNFASIPLGLQAKITFTLSGVTAGALTPIFAGDQGQARNENGTYTETITTATSGNTSFILQANADFVGSVDDVSIVWLNGQILDIIGALNGEDATPPRFTTNQNGEADKAIEMIQFGNDEIVVDQADFRINDDQGAFSFWVKTAVATTSNIILSNNNTNPDFQFEIQVASGVIKINLTNTVSQVLISSITINDDSWHHVVVQSTGTALEIYIDGTKDESASGLNTGKWLSWVPNRDYLKFGNFASSFVGVLSAIRYYNRELTQTEITALSNE